MGGKSSKDKGPNVSAPVVTYTAEACTVDEMKDGDMREIEVGDSKVLLVRDNGEYHAVGTKCSHYGAPLSKGVVCNGLVRCPFHGACFNLKTGDIEDFPGLDSIPKFEVEVKDGKVKVKARQDLLASKKIVKSMSCASQADNRNFLIVGGGPAALVAAETLRQEGFTGKVVMATKDNYLPYDRVKLSKMLDVSHDKIALRDEEFFSGHDIEVKKCKEATSVDPDKKTVTFKDGDVLTFDKLLLATGATPRVLTSVPGHDLSNIFTLRSLDDGNRIAEAAKDKNVIVIGTSFIGLEVAAFLVRMVETVTVLGRSDQPLQHVFGPKIGNAIRQLMEEKGVRFLFKTSPKEFVGEDGKLKEVVLEDDSRLPADVCVVGIGVGPTTDLLKSSGIETTGPGFVVVDKCMKTNKADVYAAGDITCFPLFMADDKQVNVQHWQMAHQQGRIAALNMLHKKTEIRSVPFFWTVLFGKSLRYTGYSGFGVGYDDIVIHGDVDELKFVAFYLKDDKVVAVASLNYDPIVAQAAEVFRGGKVFTRNDIKEEGSLKLGILARQSSQ